MAKSTATNTTDEVMPPPDVGALTTVGVRLMPQTAIEVYPVTDDDDGYYQRSVLVLGSMWDGVIVNAERGDLIRLVVKLSEHLDELDRNDAADRKVAAAETSK